MYSLLFGNCLDKMQEIPDESMDMILADLPYGTSRNTWDVQIPMKPLWEQIERVIKKHGAIVLHAQGMFTADLMQSNRKLWRYNLVWQKTQPTGFLNANRMPMRAHEDICVFYKAPPVYNPQKTYGHERKVSTAEHKRGSRIDRKVSDERAALCNRQAEVRSTQHAETRGPGGVAYQELYAARANRAGYVHGIWQYRRGRYQHGPLIRRH